MTKDKFTSSNLTPLVSVIIPVLNGEKYIAEAITSIQKQTYSNLEIIVIDDFSTDGTVKIVKDLQKKDPKITLIQNRKHLGVGGNRNIGIKLAKGKYIAWQDADDISMPDRISTQVEFLEINQDVGIVGGYLKFFGEGINSSIRKYDLDDLSLRKKIFRYNPLAQPAALVRKECFKTVGQYKPELKNASEDLEMFFRIGTKYKFGNVQKVIIKYRQYGSSQTNRYLKEMEKTTIKLRLLYSFSPAYKATIFDYFYNLAQYLSIYLVPSELKIKIFTFFRNQKA